MNLQQFMDSHQPRLKQAQMAAIIGVTQGRIGHWYRGEDMPPPATCVLLERYSNGQITRQELRPLDWHTIWPELKPLEP
jgi:DNA-binding transcriptional regulator YdaS (Cro superfamily)